MKITIKQEKAVYGDGSIFFWFFFADQCRFFLIFPIADTGWQVSRYGAQHRDWRFPSLKQAREFALTAAVLYAHGRPIPIQ